MKTYLFSMTASAVIGWYLGWSMGYEEGTDRGYEAATEYFETIKKDELMRSLHNDNFKEI